jgi:YidC/Oxa1 family membrane protein insertase
MEKRLLQTILITFLFLTGYMYLTAKFFPNTQTSAPKNQESPAQPAKPTLDETNPLFSQENSLNTAMLDNFSITYSAKGGYIQKIELKDYKAELPIGTIGVVLAEKDIKFKPQILNDRLTFLYPDGNRKEFIFSKNTLTIQFSSPRSSPLVCFSNALNNNKIEQKFLEIFYYKNNTLHKFLPQKIKEEVIDKVNFAGIGDNYFCASLLKGTYEIQYLKDKEYTYVALLPPLSSVSFYIGPQTEKALKPLGLESIINYGFFHSIGIGLSKLLYFFHSFTKNWGLSIILLSILTYIILLPFTAKSTKAMRKMQEIQPEIDELRKKYRDNPQKLNKETLEIYKKYKINPIGGCLPLVFQFPVFIALYQVLIKFVEFKNSEFLWIKDLSLPDHALKLPFPAPVDYLNILPLLIVVVGLVQQKFASPVSVSNQHKSMGFMMIFLMGVIFYNFPSGLTLYWLTQNILTFLYQFRVTHK